MRIRIYYMHTQNSLSQVHIQEYTDIHFHVHFSRCGHTLVCANKHLQTHGCACMHSTCTTEPIPIQYIYNTNAYAHSTMQTQPQYLYNSSVVRCKFRPDCALGDKRVEIGIQTQFDDPTPLWPWAMIFARNCHGNWFYIIWSLFQTYSFQPVLKWHHYHKRMKLHSRLH